MPTEKNSLLHREPVLITTLIRSALLLATAFGLRLEPEQIAAVLVFTEAALAILVRGSVTSPASSAAGTAVLAPSASPTGQAAAG
ncbi:MAG: hypothetical protein M3144_01320 [Actinomycetota bacterium]|nr:hypothetical protein [Actinomycetota bacterium]